MTILTPGANAVVPEGTLDIIIQHQVIPKTEIDISAFLLTKSGKVRNDNDMCFYGQPTIANGAIVLSSSVNGETKFTVHINSLPQEIEKVVFTATIYENTTSFNQIDDIKINASGVQGQILCSNMSETALILAEVYLRNNIWKLRIVGQGFNGGLSPLATHMGVEIIEDNHKNNDQTPQPPKADVPKKINISKVSLTKENKTINLNKENGKFGIIKVNLNWNQKTKPKGLFSSFSSSAIDLDIGAFVESTDGNRWCIQALGKTFGNFEQAPYTKLLGDDRTGQTNGGEWLHINGNEWIRIKRVLIFAFIYKGSANWKETDGFIRLLIPEQPEVEIKMNDYDDKRRMCAIATLENDNGQVNVSRKVTFHNGHMDMDKYYDWNFEWSAGGGK